MLNIRRSDMDDDKLIERDIARADEIMAELVDGDAGGALYPLWVNLTRLLVVSGCPPKS
jgi:hypothetical protein